jgi:hypothetical protein
VPGTAFNSSNWDGYDSASFTLAASQTDFTLIVDLSRMSSSWNAAVQSDGGCIRVTKSDGTTELAYDLIDFDNTTTPGSPTGHLRVLFSGASGTGSNTIRIWTDYNAGTAVAYDATETYGSDNAYDSSWAGYWPMDDDDITDRTSNSLDLTRRGTPVSVTGKVGGAYDLGGGSLSGNSWSVVTDALRVSDATFSAWVYRDDSNGGNDYIWSYSYDAASRYLIRGKGGNLEGYDDIANENQTHQFKAAAFAFYTWVHLVLVVNNDGSKTAHLDGSATGITQDTDGSNLASITSGATLALGVLATSHEWPGYLDEMQVHTAGRDSGWVTAEYNQTNDNATFWGTWSWTDDSGGGGTPVPVFAHHYRQLARA